MSKYQEWGWLGGWLPACIVVITIRWTVFGNDSVDLLWVYIGIGAIWLLCGLVGNLLDKNQRTKEEMQSLNREAAIQSANNKADIKSLKNRIDELER